jgi:hypothetical protein
MLIMAKKQVDTIPNILLYGNSVSSLTTTTITTTTTTTTTTTNTTCVRLKLLLAPWDPLTPSYNKK